MDEKELLLGFVTLYDSETDTTTVSWAYREDPALQHFVLEVWDEVGRRWRPYDNRMGVIPKDPV